MTDIYNYEPLFGSWQIESRLGFGGYGEVHKICRETMGFKQYAAVKKISIPSEADPRQLERVRTEIQTMLQMQGANNIVRIEEFAELDWPRGGGKDILIRMELLTSLDSIIKKTILPVDEAVKLGIHICKALELCESANIIHRDIKPGNILVSGYGEYKLGDFGIARSMGERRTFTGIGTDDFIAPEVFGMFGKRDYDLRADIYSLGITLYYLLNQNMLPFEDTDSEGHILRRRMGEALPVPKNAPGWLTKVVLKACGHKPEDRYASAAEMRAALEQAGLNTSTVTRPQAVPSNIDPDECYKNGEIYYLGTGAAKDYAKAAEWYRNAAEQGHADAQNDLGAMYQNGHGVPQDYEVAVKWFRKAAKQGNANAHYNLGSMYYTGRGVTKSYKQAVKWLGIVAEQGYADAQHDLGCMYFNGQGVPQDPKEAIKWFRKAARQGQADAQYHLGLIYHNGFSVTKNKTQAIKWYSEAAAQGHEEAQEALDEF